ncbi:ABC transporter ATP-binding protein [Robiginitalea sediminis]|uniref:ABC transporter ATP-binding protein n=1 Tax=Robiginitalea sediminis TaxID=1982593 RepID=UPI000B4ACB62|nr:ABC transporter ATP-binding protein [Robiginitalea sediminis]
MIRATDIHKFYGELEVLKGVSLEIAKGEIVSVVGASGAGKTTLLQILGTLDSPSPGYPTQIEIDGQDVTRLGSKQLARFRNRHVGFIFQFHQLLPEFTALENVCIPAYIMGAGKEEAERDAAEIMTFLGLEHRLGHKPSELSGGEQQRVAVARALINKPGVILADEPSGNLDSASADRLHRLFFDLRDSYGQTFVIVTHNKELAGMADRKLTMVDGRIVSQ